MSRSTSARRESRKTLQASKFSVPPAGLESATIRLRRPAESPICGVCDLFFLAFVPHQRYAAGLPVWVRPSGGREFGSLQCPNTRNLERCRCNSPTTSSGSATVSRRPRGHRASRRLRSSPGLAVSFRPATSLLCASLPIRPTAPNSQQPSNDAEYLLPTAPVSNEQFPSLYSMRHECYQYR
jgi:hypothetical protein